MDIKSLFRRKRKIFGGFFCISGLVCMIISCAFAVHTEYFLLHAIRAKGTIIHMVPVERESDGSVTLEYAPVFSFQTESGQNYSITSNTSTNPPEFRDGDAITVLYSRGNPNGAKLDSFAQLWLTPVILLRAF